MSTILAIDPGTTKSGWVLYSGGRVLECGIDDNHVLLDKIPFLCPNSETVCAIEMIASYGATVGRETFETCLWIGRFAQTWIASTGGRCLKVYRQDVKRCVCKTHIAKDSDVRSALIAQLGEVGTKKAPGPLYGIKSHMWPALGVGVTADDMLKRPEMWQRVEEVA